MIRILYGDTFARSDLFPKTAAFQATETVREIISDVAERGDAALYDYTERFDHCRLSRLQVSREDESLKVSILNGSSRTLPGIVRGGDAEGFPYQIALASDRRILLSLRDGSPIREYDPMDQETAAPPEGMTFPETSASEPEAAQAAVVNNNWECVSSREDIVRVNSVYSADRQISAQLELLYETGSSEIRLYCDGIGMALVFTVTVEENGSVSIPSHRLESYEPPVYETDEFIDDGTLIITIPAGEGTP